jgi:uncharacterized membrane protein HdeD (DUF308 family)
MLDLLSRNWWLLALRGLAAIIFGVLAFVWPAATIAALVILFGAYAVADGILAIAAALSNVVGQQRRWSILLQGVVSLVIGIATFVWPNVTGLTLLYLIAVWAITTGILGIVVAIELRRELSNEWLLVLSGIASIVFGVLVIVFPGAGALSVLWMIAAYAVVIGVLLLGLSLRVRNLRKLGQ